MFISNQAAPTESFQNIKNLFTKGSYPKIALKTIAIVPVIFALIKDIFNLVRPKRAPENPTNLNQVVQQLDSGQQSLIGYIKAHKVEVLTVVATVGIMLAAAWYFSDSTPSITPSITPPVTPSFTPPIIPSANPLTTNSEIPLSAPIPVAESANNDSFFNLPKINLIAENGSFGSFKDGAISIILGLVAFRYATYDGTYSGANLCYRFKRGTNSLLAKVNKKIQNIIPSFNITPLFKEDSSSGLSAAAVRGGGAQERAPLYKSIITEAAKQKLKELEETKQKKLLDHLKKLLLKPEELKKDLKESELVLKELEKSPDNQEIEKRANELKEKLILDDKDLDIYILTAENLEQLENPNYLKEILEVLNTLVKSNKNLALTESESYQIKTLSNRIIVSCMFEEPPSRDDFPDVVRGSAAPVATEVAVPNDPIASKRNPFFSEANENHLKQLKKALITSRGKKLEIDLPKLEIEIDKLNQILAKPYKTPKDMKTLEELKDLKEVLEEYGSLAGGLAKLASLASLYNAGLTKLAKAKEKEEIERETKAKKELQDFLNMQQYLSGFLPEINDKAIKGKLNQTTFHNKPETIMTCGSNVLAFLNMAFEKPDDLDNLKPEELDGLLNTGNQADNALRLDRGDPKKSDGIDIKSLIEFQIKSQKKSNSFFNKIEFFSKPLVDKGTQDQTRSLEDPNGFVLYTEGYECLAKMPLKALKFEQNYVASMVETSFHDVFKEIEENAAFVLYKGGKTVGLFVRVNVINDEKVKEFFFYDSHGSTYENGNPKGPAVIKKHNDVDVLLKSFDYFSFMPPNSKGDGPNQLHSQIDIYRVFPKEYALPEVQLEEPSAAPAAEPLPAKPSIS